MKPATSALLLLLAAPLSSPALDEAQFDDLHAQLAPVPDEAWRALPWELSIQSAQARAAKEKRPVYMLVRSGHPLGCV